MPFGLKNSECTFQRVVHEVLRDLLYLFVYIDDILVSSRTVEEHEQHLWEIFTHLRENNLTVTMEKCTLAWPTVTFLGHTVDSEGIRPFPEKVSAIRQFPQLMSKLEVQRHLGMCNLYRRFLPHLTHIVRPLNNSLSPSKKEFTINQEMLTFVDNVKKAITNATLLVHPIVTPCMLPNRSVTPAVLITFLPASSSLFEWTVLDKLH